MLYLEYHELAKKYKNAEKRYYESLDQKSNLLSLVEPGAIKVKEVISHSSRVNLDDKYITYIVKNEDLDKIINETRNNKDVLKYELTKKEILLKNSQNIYDRIYYFKYIKNKKVNEFYKLINYSKRQIYRFIDEIKENIYKS